MDRYSLNKLRRYKVVIFSDFHESDSGTPDPRGNNIKDFPNLAE